MNKIEPRISHFVYLHRAIIISKIKENPENIDIDTPIYKLDYGNEPVITFGWETWMDQHDGESDKDEKSSEEESSEEEEKEESDEE